MASTAGAKASGEGSKPGTVRQKSNWLSTWFAMHQRLNAVMASSS
jgi:hypothetical protein